MPKDETIESLAGQIAERVEALRTGESYEKIDSDQAREFADGVGRHITEAYAALGKRVGKEQPGEALVEAHAILKLDSHRVRSSDLEHAIEETAEEQGLDVTKRSIRSDLAHALRYHWVQLEHEYDCAQQALLTPVMERLLSDGPTEAKAAYELVQQHRDRLTKQEIEKWVGQIASNLPDEGIRDTRWSTMHTSQDRLTVLDTLVEDSRIELAIQFAAYPSEQAQLFRALKERKKYRHATRVLEDIDESSSESFDTTSMHRELANQAIGDLVAQNYRVQVDYVSGEHHPFRLTVERPDSKKKTPAPVEARYSSKANRALRRQPRLVQDLAAAAINERQERLGIYDD